MKSNPGTQIVRTHSLRSAALFAWWKNFICGGSVMNLGLLIAAPFYAAHLAASKPALFQAVWPLLAAGWLASVAALAYAASSFRRSICRVSENPQGITLKSFGLERVVRWEEISDFYPLDNGDWILVAGREQYHLPSKLSDFADLTGRISSRIETGKSSYTIANLLPPALKSSSLVCGTVILSVGVLSLYNALVLQPTRDFDYSVPVVLLLCTLLSWLIAFRVPRTVRAGNDGIAVSMDWEERFIPWSAVTGIRAFGMFTFIGTKSGWFCLLRGLIGQKDELKKLLVARQLQLSRQADDRSIGGPS